MIEQEPNFEKENKVSSALDPEQLPQNERQISRREFEVLILNHLFEGQTELNSLLAQAGQVEEYLNHIENVKNVADGAEELGMIVRYYTDDFGNISARYTRKKEMGFFQPKDD